MLESGEPREVHHFALLIGYGCSAINPYLAFETLDDLIREGLLPDTDHKTAIKKYIKAAIKGVVKTMAKMGISTIQSYRGAQIFEAVGLNSEVVDKYFTWTPSRIEGVGLDVIAEEALARHRRAFPDASRSTPSSTPAASINGATAANIICSIRRRFTSCRPPAASAAKRFTANTPSWSTTRRRISARCAACWISSSRKSRCRLRKSNRSRSIVKRFKTGAMSYGSISKEAHETLAIAMNRIGGK